MLARGTRIGIGIATALELLRGLWRGPYWWCMPIAAVLLLLSIVFVIFQAVPVVAPFVYVLF